MNQHSRITFMVIFLIMTSLPLRAQALLVTAGVGFIDLVHAGLKYEYKQLQVGFTVGTAFIDQKAEYTSSIDVFLHFAGDSKEVDVKPWYFRTGMNYYKNENFYSRDDIWFAKARIGKEFNFSERIGCFVEAGTVFLVVHIFEDKNTEDDIVNKTDFPPLQPSVVTGLFYRF